MSAGQRASRPRMSDPVPYEYDLPPSPPQFSTHHHPPPSSVLTSSRTPYDQYDPSPTAYQSFADATSPPLATGTTLRHPTSSSHAPHQMPPSSSWTHHRSPLPPSGRSSTAYASSTEGSGGLPPPSRSRSGARGSSSTVEEDDAEEDEEGDEDEDEEEEDEEAEEEEREGDRVGRSRESSASTGTGSSGSSNGGGKYSSQVMSWGEGGWGPSPPSTEEAKRHAARHDHPSSSSSGGSGGSGGSSKRQRYGPVTRPQPAAPPTTRRPSITTTTTTAPPQSTTQRFASRNPSISTLASVQATPGAPPLVGGFPTPTRSSNALLRRDSLRSASSPSVTASGGRTIVGGGGGADGKVRMDGGAMRMLGYPPRAPTQRKLDTPVGEYDGTPLGVGLGGFGNPSASTYDQFMHGGGGAGATGGQGQGGVRRVGSYSRLLMDEELAKTLDVQKLARGRRPSRSMAVCSHPPPSTTTGTGEGEETVMMDEVNLTSSDLDDDVPMHHHNAHEDGPTAANACPDARRLGHRWASSTNTVDDDARTRGVSSDLDDGSKDCEIGKSAGFVATPSNRRMGFVCEEAKEVVPPHEVAHPCDEVLLGRPPPPTFPRVIELSERIGICVLAVEAIWPDNRPANWSYEKSLSDRRLQPSSSSNTSSTHQQGVLPLSTFVKEVLRRSRTTAHTLHLALFYLHQNRRQIRERVGLGEQAKKRYAETVANKSSTTVAAGAGRAMGGEGEKAVEMEAIVKAMSDPVLCGRRMFLASLMCASKYLQDRNFSNRAWAKISGLPVKEVNSNERVFLNLTSYKLHVDVEAYDRWITRLQKLSEDKNGNNVKSAPSSWSTSSPATSSPTSRTGVPLGSGPVHSTPNANTNGSVGNGNGMGGNGMGGNPDRRPPTISRPRGPSVDTPTISRPVMLPPTSLRNGKVVGGGGGSTASTSSRNFASANEVVASGYHRSSTTVPARNGPTVAAGRNGASRRDRSVSVGRRMPSRRTAVPESHRQTYTVGANVGGGGGDDGDVVMAAAALHDRPSSAASCGIQDVGAVSSWDYALPGGGYHHPHHHHQYHQQGQQGGPAGAYHRGEGFGWSTASVY